MVTGNLLSLCTLRERDLQILVIHPPLLLWCCMIHDWSDMIISNYIVTYGWGLLYSWISRCSLEHPFLILYYINYAIILSSGLLYFLLEHEQTLALVLWEMVFNAKLDLFLNCKFSLSKWYLVDNYSCILAAAVRKEIADETDRETGRSKQISSVPIHLSIFSPHGKMQTLAGYIVAVTLSHLNCSLPRDCCLLQRIYGFPLACWLCHRLDSHNVFESCYVVYLI